MNHIIAGTTDTSATNFGTKPRRRSEVALVGGIETGIRNDPEGSMVAAVRTASNGIAIIELVIDPATSGFDNIAWLTTEEAVAYAHAILTSVASTRGLPQN